MDLVLALLRFIKFVFIKVEIDFRSSFSSLKFSTWLRKITVSPAYCIISNFLKCSVKLLKIKIMSSRDPSIVPWGDSAKHWFFGRKEFC